MGAKFLIVLYAGLVLVGCATHDYAMTELTGKEFLELYFHPGTINDYWEYKGKSGGKHWIYHYRQERQSFPLLVEKAYVPLDAVPAGFPQAQQPNRETGSLEKAKDVLKSLGIPKDEEPEK
jgi:hypothetical protein